MISASRSSKESLLAAGVEEVTLGSYSPQSDSYDISNDLSSYIASCYIQHIDYKSEYNQVTYNRIH
jgi:hypothetical protein